LLGPECEPEDKSVPENWLLLMEYSPTYPGSQDALDTEQARTPKPLAPLREELTLHPGPRASDGSPTWTLHDPAANRFFRIGWAEFEMLSRWNLQEAGAIARRITRETTLTVSVEDVEAFARFLAGSQLLQVAGKAATEELVRQEAARKKHWTSRLLHNYLFFRIPLVRPHGLLRALRPIVQPLYTRTFLSVVVVAALLGVWLVGRQWDHFLAGFPYLFTLEGVLLTGAALTLSKVLHELGHAVTADRYGCRVPTMGVAFLVLWPVLYTDTSDAWKLASRRQRLAIGAAGMAAELALAAFAALAWSLLPDGPLRSACFLLAASTWVLTLTVNLNPFMRFDGYYLLSDALDIANLQDRSFALARWWLRERLWGFGDPPPEVWPAQRRRVLIGYAFATWIYRFFLFLGIALLVYHLFFKVLGVLLFAVEIAWFIVRPIANELSAWAKRRTDLRMNRHVWMTAIVLLAGIALCVIPWRGTVPAPAVLRAEQQSVLYVPQAARLAGIHARPGDAVNAGDAVFELESPDLLYAHAQARRKVDSLTWQAEVQSLRHEMGEPIAAVWEELAQARAELASHEAELARLVVRAPFSGVLIERTEPLAIGEWLPEGEALGLLIDPGSAFIEAYVEELDMSRIAPGAAATFHPEDPARAAVEATVTAIDRVSARQLQEPALASVYGGVIPVRESADGQLVPEKPVYRVRLRPQVPAPSQLMRGTVRIEGERQSLIAQLWRTAVGVLVRESGM
jgi:putative peptide zinc metalloprotease protein